MMMQFNPFIKKQLAINYIDDAIMQSQNKNEIFRVINEHHTILQNAGFEAALKKHSSFSGKLEFLVTLYPQ